MFAIGKFKGRKVSDVAKEDPCYCQWFYNNMQDDYSSICDTIMDCIDVTSIYLNFGKYKNTTLKHVKETDEKYVKFLLNSDYVKNKRQDILTELNNGLS